MMINPAPTLLRGFSRRDTPAAGASSVQDTEQELDSPEFGPLGPRLDPANSAPSAATALADCVLDGDHRDALPAAGDAPAAGSGGTAMVPGDSAEPSALEDDGTAAAASCVLSSATHVFCGWLYSVWLWPPWAQQRACCRLRRLERECETPLQGCELVVACHFLWAGRFRSREMHALDCASFLRISQVRLSWLLS